jgi:phytoene/squalene synthetase
MMASISANLARSIT